MIAPLASNAARTLLYPVFYARRRATVPEGSWVQVRLHGAITEIQHPVRRWTRTLFRAQGGQVTVADLRALCVSVAADPAVHGVVFRIGGLQCGWATVASLRELLTTLRTAGKRTVAYLPEGAETREFHLALAADKILTTPQATVAPMGLASGMNFLRSLLARGGIEAEVLARREYKSAAEMFTRDGLSDPNRVQINALLDRLHGDFVHALSEGRRVDASRARALIDGGPYHPTDAVREGLIDGVAYDDDLPLHLGAGPNVKVIPAGPYAAMVRAMRYAPMVPRHRVGVVKVHGAIVSRARFAMGTVADAERVVAALRAARASRDIGAVVLYVDSRGGSALASDVIAREVVRLREKKPVVAYLSDVAASGGYYVSAPANEIVAQGSTVTGSIGVIALRFVVAKALESLGVTREVIRRGERADMMSPYRSWTDGERAALDRQIDGFYGDFVGLVARSRKRDPLDIEPLARGRVYAGADALDVGLVDRLGGLDLAVRRAKELAGGKYADDPVVIAPRGTLEPPEPPAAVLQILSLASERLHGARGMELMHLALAGPTENLFAFEDTDFGM